MSIDTMVSCSECNETFHPKCSIVPELEQRFLSCRRCSRARSDTLPKEFLDEFELSDKEEKEGETEEEKSKASLFEGKTWGELSKGNGEKVMKAVACNIFISRFWVSHSHDPGVPRVEKSGFGKSSFPSSL